MKKSVSHKPLQKGDFFVETGKICQEVAFIKSGLLRSFYINEKGEAYNLLHKFSNNFMTAYSSYITQMPTIENIQAFTTTELIILNKHEIEKIAEKSVSAMKFLKLVAEQGYIELEKRIFLYQKGNAQEKYYDLLKKSSRLYSSNSTTILSILFGHYSSSFKPIT